MEKTNQDWSGWETQEQVDACLAENGVSHDRMVRWRREGLLADVQQSQNAYHGSTVYYPAGTCAQIAAAALLFEGKNRVPYVGWHLWWEGYPVDEKHWLPRLQKTARFVDRSLSRIGKYLARDDENPGKRTLQERVAYGSATNVVMSRIRGRQSGEALATTIGVVVQVATGEFDRFSVTDAAVEGDDADKSRTIEALDIGASQSDRTFGERLELVRELPSVYASISKALASGDLSQLLTQPNDVIFRARDDVRNSLRIYVAQYEAMKWIYGPTAFGLRLGAWIGRKQPEMLMPLLVLGVARLRQTSNQFLSSEEIAKLADQAEANAQMSNQVRELAKAHPEFRPLFTAKRMRMALQDKPTMERFLREVEAARQSA